MVAIFLKKFAVVVGGFFAGGYLLIELLKLLDVRTGDYYWLVFIAGGLVGAVLMSIVFSCFDCSGLPCGATMVGLLFTCLAILGFVIQFGLVRRTPPPAHL
jgi:hypothetical protein